ncbi:MAG: hypothetical protein COB66_01760 [Coxiella sp. (in: Bacteria)]|nr:MAG: hypothetical protein COB66_01760 [Coxiella sp. (in: g-proteobacteria)]
MNTRRHHAAFTLIELLVVLIIIGIVLMVALMAFGDFGQSRRQKLAVIELKESITAAQQQAILQPAVLGLSFTKHGYFYLRYWVNPRTNKTTWRPLESDALSNKNAFGDGADVKLQTLTNSNAHHRPGPRIYFLPNGTVSHFSVRIHYRDKKHYLLQTNDSGEVSIE